VEIPRGTHTFGPENGTLWVKTGRGGAAAMAGHDLLIQVTGWEATLEVPADPSACRLTVDVDPTSLRVRDGAGGMQPLVDEDKESIRQTIDDEVLQGMGIEFRSSGVEVYDGRIAVEGDLTLVGNVHPLAFELIVAEDLKLAGSFGLRQTEWGLEPYSALFGALKVADEVEVSVDAVWPGGEGAALDDLPEWSAPELEWTFTPVVDPGISSFVWAVVFFLYLWLGMVVVGVSSATAFVVALVTGCFLFLLIRTRGVGYEDGPDDRVRDADPGG
jgi:polyisoprenoid-binding protein YceI